MKKLVAIIMMVCMTLSLTVGCGEEAVTVDVKQMAADLKANLEFVDELSEVDTETALALYGLTTEQVPNSSVYMSSMATAEEIAVFEAKDSETLEQVKAAVDQRIVDQRKAYEDYVPGELEKLTDPTIVVKGNYVVLCVSDDDDASKKEIESLMK